MNIARDCGTCVRCRSFLRLRCSRWDGPRAAARHRFCLRCLAKWFSIAGPPASARFGDAPAWAFFSAARLRTGWAGGCPFKDYKLAVFIDYVVHGGAYVLFSRMQRFELALLFILVSRAAMAVNSILNYSYILKDRFGPISRARLFDDRDAYVDDDDAFDDGSGNCVHALQPPNHRNCCRLAQFVHRDLLGMGQLDGPAAVAGSVRRGNERSGNPWRPSGLTSDLTKGCAVEAGSRKRILDAALPLTARARGVYNGIRWAALF
jgi:hypothetical protein